MNILKIFKFIICSSLLFLCFSCVTDNPIYTANASDETNLFFLRPTQIDIKNNNLRYIDFDITVHVKENKLVRNPIFNCTYCVPIKESRNIENFLVQIINDEIILSPQNKKQLVKNIIKEKYLEIRYSYELDTDEFYSFLQKENSAKIKITYSDGSFDFFESEEFNQKIDNLRLLIL